MYADHTQIYTFFQAHEHSAIVRLESCMSEISDCLASNQLKRNEDKTEFMFLGHSNKKSHK